MIAACFAVPVLLGTTAAPPGAPSKPKLTKVSAIAISLRWKDGHDHGEAITKYRVEFVRFPPEVLAQYDAPVHTEDEVYAYRQPEEKELFHTGDSASVMSARVRVCVCVCVCVWDHVGFRPLLWPVRVSCLALFDPLVHPTCPSDVPPDVASCPCVHALALVVALAVVVVVVVVVLVLLLFLFLAPCSCTCTPPTHPHPSFFF